MMKTAQLIVISLGISAAFFGGLFEGVVRAAEPVGTVGIDLEASLHRRQGLAPFEYMEAPDSLPNYLPGQRWGTQGKPITMMQKPLSPKDSMKHLVVFPEFEVSLFAAEPEITKPICLAWDERGRLWIAETKDYPNEMQRPGEGRDRIKVCEDTNSDGKADKFTIFAESLSIPTSFVFANGGIIVSQAPDMLFLKDTDGDGKADVRQVLFTGWGVTDTHAGPSNLRYGFDNWIWGVVGYSGFDGTVGGEQHRFGMGFFRFKPDGSELEFIRSSNNNTWGLGLSEEGIVFGSTANGNPSMYMPIPNRYYERVSGWSASRVESIADSSRFYPITEKVRQVDWHDRYTAGAGHALYTARSFPKAYWNRASFVAEPTGHLLGRFFIEPQGADFVAKNGRNLLASDDEWTSPIAAEVGPDGALWMIDWYNYIVQHNPTPLGHKLGKGNAYETTLRDKTHGRIYRIAYKEAPQTKPLRLDRAAPQQLVEALKSDNMLWRMHAQRLLVERKQRDVAPTLVALTKDHRLDKLGLNTAAIHALWTLAGLGALQGSAPNSPVAAVAALNHPSAGVRRAAVGVLTREGSVLGSLLKAKTLEDADAQVRLAAFLAVADSPASPEAGRALANALAESRNAGDRWIRDALTSAAAQNDLVFLKTVLVSSLLPEEALSVIRWVAGHYAAKAPVDSVFEVLAALTAGPPNLSEPILNGLVAEWPRGTAPTLDATKGQLLRDLLGGLKVDVRDRLLALVLRWDRKDIFAAELPGIIEPLRKQVSDSSLSAERRISAAQRLVGLDDQAGTIDSVTGQITPQAAPALVRGLIVALSESRLDGTAEALLRLWPELTPPARRAAINTLLRRPEWTRALMDGLEQGQVQRSDLPPEQWRQLTANPDASIAERVRKIGAINSNPDRQKAFAALAPALEKRGDLNRGKELFTTACAVCHHFNGQGGQVGPDLSGIGIRPPQEILAEIVDPNRSVEANYRLWTAETKTGETYSGRLDTESQTAVELLDLTGQRHSLQRKDLTSLKASVLSIMPEGLLDQSSQEDVASLMRFLLEPGAK
jgi:putative membrane-bound dehydrogenase-like protein